MSAPRKADVAHRYSELQTAGGRFAGFGGILRAAERKAREDPRIRIDWPIHGVLAEGPFAGAREEVGRLRIHDGVVTLDGVEPDEPVHPDRDRHGPDAGGLGLGGPAAGALAPPPRGLT